MQGVTKIRVKARLPKGIEKNYVFDSNKSTDEIKNEILADDDTIDKGSYATWRVKFPESAKLIGTDFANNPVVAKKCEAGEEVVLWLVKTAPEALPMRTSSGTNLPFKARTSRPEGAKATRETFSQPKTDGWESSKQDSGSFRKARPSGFLPASRGSRTQFTEGPAIIGATKSRLSASGSSLLQNPLGSEMLSSNEQETNPNEATTSPSETIPNGSPEEPHEQMQADGLEGQQNGTDPARQMTVSMPRSPLRRDSLPKRMDIADICNRRTPVRVRLPSGEHVVLKCNPGQTALEFKNHAIDKCRGLFDLPEDKPFSLTTMDDVEIPPEQVLIEYPYICSFIQLHTMPPVILKVQGAESDSPLLLPELYQRPEVPKKLKPGQYEVEVVNFPCKGKSVVITCMRDWFLLNVREELEKLRPESEEKNFTKKYGFKIPEGEPFSNDTQHFVCEDLELASFMYIHKNTQAGNIPKILFEERDPEILKMKQRTELLIGSLVGRPLSWAHVREEVLVFRRTMAGLRYKERKEREANMAVGGIPIQLSSTSAGEDLSDKKGILVELLLPVPNHTKKTLNLEPFETGDEFLRTVWKKYTTFIMRELKVDQLNVEDYILKVFDGQPDYIDGPHPVHSFKYIRQCIFTKEKIVLELVLRSSVKIETQVLDDDPTSYTEIFDPCIKYNHKDLCLQQQMSIEKMSCLSLWDMGRQFRVRIIGVEALEATKKFLKVAGENTPVEEANVYLYVTVALYHGGSPISQLVTTSRKGTDYNPRWYEWLPFYTFVPDDQRRGQTPLLMSNIPRAARLCFTLMVSSNPTDNSKAKPLGWVACSLFDYKHHLKTGQLSLNMWPDRKANPIGTTEGNNDLSANPMVLYIQLEEYPLPIVFPTELLDETALRGGESKQTLSSDTMRRTKDKANYINLGNLTQTKEKKDKAAKAKDIQKVEEIVAKDALMQLLVDEKQLLWKYRSYLESKRPNSLPKLIQSVAYDDRIAVQEMQRMIHRWPKMENPTDALELLDAKYADSLVRDFAVRCLEELSNDQLDDYLLQLVQVLKYEPYHDSALSRFLISRALRNRKIGHAFYWYLKSELHEPTISERYQLLLEAYLRGCGTHRHELQRQNEFLKKTTEIAYRLKGYTHPDKESKVEQLRKELNTVSFPESFQLPLNPKFRVKGILVNKCTFMSSKKMPLWLVFENAEEGLPIYTIFKAGDDLRQDMLTLQMLRIMDKLWKQENLDMLMSPYGCIATGDQLGMIEVVLNAATTASITAKAAGAVGAFKNSPIANWLKEKNKRPEDYEEAVERFTRSCAGYCVATYVLGIGDRHNDNVMLTENGRLFHIDFGHFLGNFKTKFGYKRESAPFVFTPDFAYVMGKKGSKQYAKFTDLCCQAYNILRKHSNMFINLFAMMLSTGIPELQCVDDLAYLRKSLALDVKSDEEAAKKFAGLIDESLSCWKTRFNNYTHLMKHG